MSLPTHYRNIYFYYVNTINISTLSDYWTSQLLAAFDKIPREPAPLIPSSKRPAGLHSIQLGLQLGLQLACHWPQIGLTILCINSSGSIGISMCVKYSRSVLLLGIIPMYYSLYYAFTITLYMEENQG